MNTLKKKQRFCNSSVRGVFADGLSYDEKEPCVVSAAQVRSEVILLTRVPGLRVVL